jgi:hypothetical protein
LICISDTATIMRQRLGPQRSVSIGTNAAYPRLRFSLELTIGLSAAGPAVLELGAPWAAIAGASSIPGDVGRLLDSERPVIAHRPLRSIPAVDSNEPCRPALDPAPPTRRRTWLARATAGSWPPYSRSRPRWATASTAARAPGRRRHSQRSAEPWSRGRTEYAGSRPPDSAQSPRRRPRRGGGRRKGDQQVPDAQEPAVGAKAEVQRDTLLEMIARAKPCAVGHFADRRSSRIGRGSDNAYAAVGKGSPCWLRIAAFCIGLLQQTTDLARQPERLLRR